MSSELRSEQTSAVPAVSPGRVRRLLEGPVVQLLCRLTLAAIFLYAAIPKIAEPGAFAVDIANYRMLPGELVHPLAVTLPWIELVAAVLLVVGIWTRAAALLCGAMLLVFIAGMVAAVARGLDIACGCFGGSGNGEAMGWGTVARDFLFIVPAIVVVSWDRGRYGLQSLWRRE